MSGYKLPCELKDKEAEMSKEVVLFLMNVLFELVKFFFMN